MCCFSKNVSSRPARQHRLQTDVGLSLCAIGTLSNVMETTTNGRDGRQHQWAGGGGKRTPPPCPLLLLFNVLRKRRGLRGKANGRRGWTAVCGATLFGERLFWGGREDVLLETGRGTREGFIWTLGRIYKRLVNRCLFLLWLLSQNVDGTLFLLFFSGIYGTSFF